MWRVTNLDLIELGVPPEVLTQSLCYCEADAGSIGLHLGDVTAQPRENVMNHNAQMRECLENCTECHAICTETVQHCLQLGGKHAEAAHIRLLLDCADICQTSTDFMLRGSPQHVLTCGTCAEVCLACAESCERIGQQDSMMKKCADVCRRCAESCRQMANMKAAA
jgi:hypothetical protein